MSTLFFETTSVAELVKRGLTSHAADSAAEAIDRSSQQPMVLVVDDEHVIADTLVLILNRNGFCATAAYDGESALQLACATPPDILISDVMMPGRNGVELAIAVQRSCPHCRILLFSGNAATQSFLETAREMGHDFEFLDKPVHPDILLQRLSARALRDDAA